MPLPPRDHRIPLEAATALTRRFREQIDKSAERAGAFHANQVRDLLAQKGCMALRIYYGRQSGGLDSLVLVGVDENDKDMTGGILLEFMYPCPPFCDPGSAVNS